MPNNRQESRKSKDAVLSKLLQEKLQYEAEREALTLQMEKLDRKIIEVQAQYGAIYNESSPLLNFPTEVTCLILDYARGYAMEGDAEEGRHLLLEVVISHVCSQLRTISLAYPSLWATFRYDGTRAARIPLDRLDAYLERSASHDLELWFEFVGVEEEPEHDAADRLTLLEKTIPHIARWKRVTIFSDPDTAVLSVLHKIESISAPNLEYFAFRPNLAGRLELQTMTDHLESKIFKNGAPKLKSVMLDASSTILCLPPLFNITTLRIDSLNYPTLIPFSWPTFLAVLSLPSLENLSLIGDVFEGPTFNLVGLITMSNLKHFRFSNCNGGLWLMLLCLRASLLETLIIKDTSFEGFWIAVLSAANPQPEPYAFPSLRSLSLIDITAASPQEAWYFAQMTASATEILFSQKDPGTNFFSVLAHNQFRDAIYWSKVTSITFNFNIMSESGFLNILRFVKARPTNNITIRIFNYVDEHWRQPAILDHTEYEALAKICNIEKMRPGVDSDNPLWKGYWPLGERKSVHLIHDYDPFDINDCY